MAVILNISTLKLHANGRNNSQHCWPGPTNNVKSCCVRLHLTKRSTGFKLCATTPNNTQQHKTGCVNGHNMLHPTIVGICWPTMLPPFARGLSSTNPPILRPKRKDHHLRHFHRRVLHTHTPATGYANKLTFSLNLKVV